MQQSFEGTEKQVVGDIYTSSELFDNLITMCDEFGSRFGGSEGEIRARDFILKKFEEYGLHNVCSEPFVYTGWIRGTARMEILEPIHTEMKALSLGNVPSTSPAGLEGEVFSLGDGTLQDFKENRQSIMDKIVIVTDFMKRPIGRKDRFLYSREKYGMAVECGAKAFILMKNDPGMLIPTGFARLNMAAEIPAVGTSKEFGQLMIRLLKKGTVNARIHLRNEIKPTTSWNIAGEIAGNQLPDEVIIVGAHLDGWDISQGAMDDASGACVVMELARTLAKHEGAFRRTIRFICFAAEELGLHGSYAYVKAHKDELKKVSIMINLDSVGTSGKKTFFVDPGSPDLVNHLRDISIKINYPMEIIEKTEAGTDNFPFFLNGVPTAWFWLTPESRADSHDMAFSHTEADTLDKVEPEAFRESTVRIARVIMRLANASKPIARHLRQREVEKLLEDQGLTETLKIEKRYPFCGK